MALLAQLPKAGLDCLSGISTDGLSIRAAPGSGKQPIGIELIARFDKPALFCATVTIREQWVDRILPGFFKGWGPQITSLCLKISRT